MTEIIDGEEFSWWGHPSVVLKPRLAVAIYVDGNELVIRQERDICEAEDSKVCIPLSEAMAILDRGLDLMGVPSFGGPAPGWREETPEPPSDTANVDSKSTKDSTAAERMRRYRQRKRNGDAETVTSDRNNVTQLSDAAE